MALLRGVFIVAAKRTPFGAYGGLLKDFSATDLTEFAARAALSAGKVPPETIDSCPDAILLSWVLVQSLLSMEH
ncbi:acetyl-Coenzyme A acyltransferase 2 (mitochondrial 3-oxoacyl-Coenzyme A thiolase), isoform CRA_i [Mus musculus]|nr:acetyl-Coenzyme A acyltransferase 2 (mitochondrial 3-oxoacyl-Coenzyme A thiolase), isoform CRA_i [Mus musculus]